MEKGFYYISDKNFERCYYITNENEGNKVVDFTEIDDDKKKTIINPKWKSLIGIPEEIILKSASYYVLNPTNCVLK